MPGKPNPEETPSHPNKTVEEKQKDVEEEHRQAAQKKVHEIHDDMMKAKTPEDKERGELLKKIGEHLKNFGEESNIPVPHDYWNLTQRYRQLQAEHRV